MDTTAHYHWQKFEGVIPAGAVHASEKYIVARMIYNNEWMPGKFHSTDFKGYVPFNGKEHEVAGDPELLVAAPGATIEWVPMRWGDVPVANGVGPLGAEGFYVGRALCPAPESAHTPGKIHPLKKEFFLSWGGKEIAHQDYEALEIKAPAKVIEIIKVVEVDHHGHHHH